jgi:nucleoside-diphosphate-sugar epimerase
MKVVITGGGGFLGQRLARVLLDRGRLTGTDGGEAEIDDLVLFDAVATPPIDGAGPVRSAQGDIGDRATVERLIDRDDIAVFHLASMVSGEGEQDFDRALRVNLMGGLHLFEALRARASCPRVVFASSIAVFGGPAMPPRVGDMTRPVPQTTYGMTKAVGELLVNDFSRKGFLDGRSARLPTIIIRPGKPNAAASSFASAVFREPLAGTDYVLPVSPETAMPVLGYRAVVDCLVRLHELSAAELGADRAVGLPSLNVTVADMIEALERTAGDRPLGRITIEPDPFIQGICDSWPRATAYDRTDALAMPRESTLDEIVAYYIDDYVDG